MKGSVSKRVPLVRVFKEVSDSEGGREPLDPALDQLQIRIIAQAKSIKPFRLGSGYIAWCGAAGWIGILVMTDQGLPMLVTRAFD